VDDHLFLEVLDGQRDLPQVVPGLQFCNPLPTLDELVEGLVGTEFEDDVDVGAVLEGPLVLHHKLRPDGLVDFNFGCKLGKTGGTFSLALERVRLAFSMILAANFFPVARLVNS
jgi:hypothetical protein